MKKYDDVRAERASGGRETLPAGGYVCQIISAKVESNDWGDTLVIAHDVCEGEYAGIFRRDYEGNDREDKKWRGTFRIRLPKDDGSQQDAWKKRSLGNTIWAIEQSNPGYTWNWDEKTLKGLKIGLIYRNKEWEYEGRSGWTTEAGAAESIDNIRNNKFRPLKDKPLPDRPADSGAAYGSAESEADLPF
jgi:hypothetical protein